MTFDPRDRELSIPAHVYGDENPRELLRAWAAHNQLFVVFNPTQLWEQPDNWGIFLDDVARHVARAYTMEKGLNEEATLQSIRASFKKAAEETPYGKTEPAPSLKRGN
jgi:hypothetical protein